MIDLNRLKAEADETEKRRRMAARRVTWLEQQLYQCTTGADFDAKNAELEEAMKVTQLYGLQALKARLAYTNADIQARYGAATT